MSGKAQAAYEIFKKAEGKESATGDWMEIDQDLIDRFADVTKDHQYIHVDPEKAATTPFGTTIAHGFLTLSMLTHLRATAKPSGVDPARNEGRAMGINYGFDKVRFINPVKVGSRIRLHSLLSNVELKGSAVQLTQSMTIEIEGEEKPALAADWITRSVYS
jgi:acyl dehydratase